MLEFLLSPSNSYYAIAFCIVLLLLLIEILGQLFGISVSQLLDNSADADVSSPASFNGSFDVLSWLGIKKVPALIWLISFLTLFAIIGVSVNLASMQLFELNLAKNISAFFVLAFTMFFNGKVCHVLARFIPKEETSAVSKDSFSGLLANITVGTAKKGQPAEAVVKDEYNQKHYVLVEPIDDDQFSQGENVVLVQKENSTWLVTRFN